MNRTYRSIGHQLRLAGLAVALSLLTACASYGPGHSSTRYYSGYGYYHPAGAAYYPRPYAYYGRYAPGWFVAGPYFPGSYWGFGAMVYWPTYASSYYYGSHYSGGYYYSRYYPYWDPWYPGYMGHYRPVHGPYYSAWGGTHTSYGNPGYNTHRPYPGNSSSYQPPARQRDPLARRSSTVVTQPEGMTRFTSVAPEGSGNSGMVVSNRGERKVQPSRLHPIAPDTPGSSVTGATGMVVSPARPVQATAEPLNFNGRRRTDRAPAFSAAPRAEAEASSLPASRPMLRQEPVYQHRLDSNSIQSEAEFRQRGGDRPGRDRDLDRNRERDGDRNRQ